MRIDSPLPHRYVTDDPGVGGRLKQRPEDFIVDEIPQYEPCGEGEHLYLRVQKVGVAHGELISRLRRYFDVPQRAIGYAGMKDKHAVTRQTVSIHLPKDPPVIRRDLDHDRITILWTDRHTNKIRRGHLRGNRFSIRIRDVDPIKAPAVSRTLNRLARIGAPTYFGSQRFGYRHNNYVLGAALLREDYHGLLAELLGARGTAFPEYQRERRELFDEGRYVEAAEHWSTADRAELIAIRRLAEGRSPGEAVRAIGAITLNFFASSLMSAAFNRVLDRRIDDGLVGRLLKGDLAWKHDSRAVFRVTEQELATGALGPRLEAFEISPSGPLWGESMIQADGAVAVIEQEALDATGLDLETVLKSRYRPEGARRPFRAPIENVDVEGGFDEHGPYIRCALDLPRGVYATMTMREIMKPDHVV